MSAFTIGAAYSIEGCRNGVSVSKIVKINGSGCEFITYSDGLDDTEEGTIKLKYCPVLDYDDGTLTVRLLLPEQYTGPLTYDTGGEVYSHTVTYLGTFKNRLSATYSIENTGLDNAYPCLTFRDLETGDVYQTSFLDIGPLGLLLADRQTGILTINNDVNEVVYDIHSTSTPLTIGTETGISRVEAFIDLSATAGPDVSLAYKSLKIK